MQRFDNEVFDLIINTTSLGEMTDEMQNYYLANIERCSKEYFYSVNRAKKRVEKYNSRGFTILILKINGFLKCIIIHILTILNFLEKNKEKN